LTGSNFSANLADNAVFLSYGSLNLKCENLSATTTELVVRTPPRDSSVPAGQAFTVVVQGRLIEEATCNGDCTFTYTSLNIPTLDVPTFTEIVNG